MTTNQKAVFDFLTSKGLSPTLGRYGVVEAVVRFKSGIGIKVSYRNLNSAQRDYEQFAHKLA